MMQLSSQFHSSARKRSPIGLTSLIDVVFILLLFFMLSSTFAPIAALNITASSHGAGKDISEAKPVVIVVLNAEQIRIGQTTYSYLHDTDATKPLQQAIEQDAAIMVHAGAAATVQSVIDALAYLEQLGARNTHLGESTEPARAE